jgi:glycosyltransferase involved in cell wall biosynthesis
LPWKGTAVAIEAVQRVRKELPNARIVSFGHHQPDGELPLPSGATFHWRPAQERIRDIYASADVWLCASTTEGFALPPLEAMACRCPVVCTRCGGPEDFVREGENGFLVDVGDASAMADRTLTLLKDRERHARMSDAAYATRLDYTWEKAVARFEVALFDESNARPSRLRDDATVSSTPVDHA